MDMQIDILTLFPESVDAMLNVSILGRAQERGYIAIRTHQIRTYTTNKQMQVDDYPYGGGRGAVMQADPLFRCWEHVVNTYGPGRTIFMSPCGRTFTQSVARELKAQYDHLILVCGHYEGIDQRFIDACVDEELSMGDFVLTGGEIPAMAVADAVCRMVPGVLPDAECFEEESHWDGLLEYPQYSRPAVWHDRAVPEILLSGEETAEAFTPVAENIISAVQAVLERTPPELAADVAVSGILLTGGGSLLQGMDTLLAARTGMETHLAEDPIRAVALGLEQTLPHLAKRQEGVLNLARRRQLTV